jgi:hypothetical protein
MTVTGTDTTDTEIKRVMIGNKFRIETFITNLVPAIEAYNPFRPKIRAHVTKSGDNLSTAFRKVTRMSSREFGR